VKVRLRHPDRQVELTGLRRELADEVMPVEVYGTR
jgi:hypothetical protein